MTKNSLAPKPALPPVRGVRAATPADSWTIVWWSLRWILHRRPWWFKVAALLSAAILLVSPWTSGHPWFLVAAVLVLALVLARQWLMLATGREVAVLYCPDGEPLSAVSIKRTRRGWSPTNHVSKRPGSGYGRALRALVVAPVLAQADAERVEIYTTAASKSLADAYAADLPGLVDVGAGFPLGRKMRRDPR